MGIAGYAHRGMCPLNRFLKHQQLAATQLCFFDSRHSTLQGLRENILRCSDFPEILGAFEVSTVDLDMYVNKPKRLL